MTQARQAERSIPQAAFLFPAALAAALVLGLIVAFGMIALPRVDVGTLGNVTSPAVVESGHGVLVRHPAGEVQRVGDGLRLGRVGVEARAAESGAERGGVDGDHRAEPDCGVGDEHDLLVAVARHELGDGTAADGRHVVSLP